MTLLENLMKMGTAQVRLGQPIYMTRDGTPPCMSQIETTPTPTLWGSIAVPVDIAVLFICIVFALSRIDKIAAAWRRSELDFRWLKTALAFLVPPLVAAFGAASGVGFLRAVEWASGVNGHADPLIYAVFMLIGVGLALSEASIMAEAKK